MSNCCEGRGQKKEGSPCCGGGRNVLLYACSGCSNVAEIADKTARELMFSGCGSMACLAGLGADIQGMVQSARDSDLNVVIDGCPVECARKILDRHGIANYRHIRVTDLGIEKTKGVRCRDKEVQKTIEKVRELIA